MEITFDSAKNIHNIEMRGLSFELVEMFEWYDALIIEDARQDYGERRFQALGLISDRLYMLVFTPRQDSVRVISLRKANRREVSRYDQASRSRTNR